MSLSFASDNPSVEKNSDLGFDGDNRCRDMLLVFQSQLMVDRYWDALKLAEEDDLDTEVTFLRNASLYISQC